MATDTKGNLFEKVGTINGIVFVRKFSPYSDDPEWGQLEFYSIYNGIVITTFESGEFHRESWELFSKVGSVQNLLERNTLALLRKQTRERIESLAVLAHGL